MNAAQTMSAYFEKKQAIRTDLRKSLFETAWHDFEKICQHIMDQYKPERIYQWGSLLNERHFSEISDIDIAVEGIDDPKTYFRLLYEAAEMSRLPVDIVQIEFVPDYHKERILKRGRLVYERKPGNNS
jgi:predicted nucleotidyltransferase